MLLGTPVAISGLSQASEDDSPVVPNGPIGGGGDGYPVEKSTFDSYSGYDLSGNESDLNQSTGVVLYQPNYQPGIGRWEAEIVVDSSLAMRYPDGSKCYELWQTNTVMSPDNHEVRSEDNPRWFGAGPGDIDSFDYGNYSTAVSAMSLAVGAINPPAGTALSVGNLLLTLVYDALGDQHQLGPDSVSHDWRVDNYVGYPTDAGTHAVGRASFPDGAGDTLRINTYALTPNESVTDMELSVSYNTLADPQSLTAREREEAGIKKVTAQQTANAPSVTTADASNPNEAVYVATRPAVSVEVLDELSKEGREDRERFVKSALDSQE